MFIRPCYRRKDGKRHAYWALMESYRTERGPRQRIVAYLGQLDESQRLGIKNAAEGNAESRQKQLFDDTRPHWVEVDVKRIRRRCVTQPTEHQAILLAHLKLNLPTLPLTDGV